MEMLIPVVNQALSFFEWLGAECLPGRGQCLQDEINPVILGWKFSLIHQHVRWCVAYTVTSLEVHYIHYMWMIKPLSSLKNTDTEVVMPVCAVGLVKPAFLIRWVERVR